MSKASEYAKECLKQLIPPAAFAHDSRIAAEVTALGFLHIKELFLDQTEALKLAAWIIATFGEGEDDQDPLRSPPR